MNDDWMTEGERSLLETRDALGNAAMQLGIASAEELADMAHFYHAGRHRLTLVKGAAQQITLALRGLE